MRDHRLSKLVRSKAAAAVVANLVLALTNVLLPILASRELGAAGVGMFAVLYGAIVMVTAISSGLVGDTLTVLDRHDPGIRAGLASWWLLIAVSSGILGAVITLGCGALSGMAAAWFGLATVAFLLKEVWRRVLMVVGAYWRLPTVDIVGLVVSLLALLAWSAGPGLDIAAFLSAVFAGQVAGGLMAWWLLPSGERKIARLRGAAMRTVFHFGGWRAAQLTVRPTTLTAARLIITAVAGIAAYGQLEAARLSMAPLLVIVAGLGTYLLPMFTQMRAVPLVESLRYADKITVSLAVSIILLGALGTVALPLVGPIISGGNYEISSVAAFGWAFYACAGAISLPYGQLSALHARQSTATGIRLLELVVSILLVVPAVAVSVSAVPYALALAVLLTGAALRQLVLLPLRTRG